MLAVSVRRYFTGVLYGLCTPALCCALPAVAADRAPAAAVPAVPASHVGSLLSTVRPVVAETWRLTGTSGNVERLRAGRRDPLQIGTSLKVGDHIAAGPAAGVTVAMGDRGELAIGSDTRLAVEALPSPQHPDGPTILTVEAGAVHVLWHAVQDPGTAARPLYVYSGRSRFSLQPGEYFLHRAPAASTVQVCIASGGLSWQAIGSARRGTVAASRCMDMQASRLSETSFTAARQQALPAAWDLPALQPAVQVATGDSSIAVTADEPRDGQGQVSGESSVQTHAARQGGSDWAINVASSLDPEDAERQRRKLVDAGYAAIVVPAQVDGRMRYRIQLPGFASRSEAQARVASLEAGTMAGRQLWVVPGR